MSSGTTVQLQLESPGAGLPAFELAWLRIMFRCGCVLISLDAGLRWFNFEARKIAALARSAAAEQGALPVLINRVVASKTAAAIGRCSSCSIICGLLTEG